MRKNLTVPRQLMPKEGKIYAKTTQLLCVPSDSKNLPEHFLLFKKDALAIKSGQFRFSIYLFVSLNQCKGQLISKCPFGVIVWTKIPTKFFRGSLP